MRANHARGAIVAASGTRASETARIVGTDSTDSPSLARVLLALEQLA
jgi:hypothetical protein